MLRLKKRESQIWFSGPGKLLLIVSNVVALGLLLAQFMRNPWIDEITTFYFAESAENSLQRYAGDPHPYGYYFAVLILNNIFGFAATQGSLLSIWPIVKIVVFFFYFIVFASLMVLFSLSQIRKQPSLIWIFAVVLPSLVGFAATFEVATDLRNYGAQALGAVFIACGMLANFARDSISKREVAFFSLAIGILGSLHVWSSLLAMWMYFVAILVWKSSSRRLFVSGALISFPICFLSYLPLFLTRDLASGVGESGVDGLVSWAYGLAAGFSYPSLMAVPLFVVWAWFLIRGKKSIALVFDFPALSTIFLAFVISISLLPIFTWYVLAPVYALLFAATLLRVGQMDKGSFMGFIFILVALYASLAPMNATDTSTRTHRGALSDKQNWSETSKRALEELSLRDKGVVFSNNRSQLSYLLPNIVVLQLTDLAGRDCAAPSPDEEIVVINHASVSRQQSLKTKYGLEKLATWQTGGVYVWICEAQRGSLD